MPTDGTPWDAMAGGEGHLPPGEGRIAAAYRAGALEGIPMDEVFRE